MRAQQSKFLASINSSADDELNISKFGQEVCPPDVGHDSEESAKVICSLCRDPNSKDPVCFLILLQKSRLLSFVDKGPPSWEQVRQSGKDPIFMSTDTMNVSFQRSTVSRSSEMISSSQLMHLIQNAVNEFASNGSPREVDAFLEFVKTRFPSVRNIQIPCTSNDTMEKTASSLEAMEERMYSLIRGEMHDTLSCSDFAKNNEKFSTAGGAPTSGDADSLFLGKYIAALSKEMLDNPSASESAHARGDKAQLESTVPLPAYDGFRPPDCDGIYVSSCGHAVHQGCLDRYLLSLKERFSRRIVFEGGHIVDPDQGEFLCPVCRGFANCVLPALPGDSKRGCKLPISTVGPSDAAGSLTSSNRIVGSLHLQQALSLLQCAADVAGRKEILKALPMQRNGRIRPHLEYVFRILHGMYFPGKDKIPGSGRLNCSLILWDTLKYSLISMEIAARSGRISLTPYNAIGTLYKELNSSSGFILSLWLKVVQSMRSKTSLSLILRLRSIQLFVESICFGVSQTCKARGNMLCILANTEVEVQYPDIQFWRRASGPVLAHDAFSSLMWILFCLPCPFLSCEETFISLVHIFYVVSITQAIITYFQKHQGNITEMGYHDCLITDIWRNMGEYRVAQMYFDSNYIDPSGDIKDIIRQLSLPYLRRCALLWKLINSSTSAPFSGGSHVSDISSHATLERMEFAVGILEELAEVEELEKMFEIPPLDIVLNDELLRSLVVKWLNHFSKEFEGGKLQRVLHSTPAVPFKLMLLPHLYQDLLQRYIKQHCSNCGVVLEEPALCLLCGKLCSPSWKTCCRESSCQTHAMACGAGTGVFLLIRKTTILLQRSARQAPWPSPYLDAFGEEDIEMNRGKPLYLNEERYASLNHMVASHGLDRSSKVTKDILLRF
ncbi:unnamed protein product [Ilex paraguariensis]|uniref:E3 ubiquitin-protein ligase n=1 Tax=Ilex paraguariensis TaxID=185542 RepID=A0ABC8UW35_9AQUA